MGSLIFVLLSVGICCHRVSCNSSTTTDGTVFVTKFEELATTSENENQPMEKEETPKDLDPVVAEQFKLERLKSMANVKMDLAKRKSRILGSLAFLAGLGVGGLTGAASSSMKTYARVPQASLTFNLGSSRISPFITAFYDPYPYATHPYVLASPFGLIPLLDASRLQSATGAGPENAVQHVGQNQIPSQVLNIFDNKRPGDALDGNEEYVEEGKTENDETSSDPEEETDNRTESALEADRNAEEKVATRTVVCTTSKGSHKKPTNFAKETRDRGDLMQPVFDISLETTTVGGRNRTKKPHHHHHHRTTTTEQSVDSTTAQDVTSPPGMKTNKTGHPPFFGYYGGSPQDINNVDFTTDVNTHRYDYAQINYNLPYDRPANFNPDKYNYYPSPQYNSYSAIPYQQEQIPEYFNTDFSRYLFTPESPPTFTNGFRPVS